ncbi:hypothetical protein GCM10020255_060050 [Rhodococcus baikonurensis]
MQPHAGEPSSLLPSILEIDGQNVQIDIFGERYRLAGSTQNRFASLRIRRRYEYESFESAGPQEGWVDQIRSVGGAQHHDVA